MDCNIAHLDVSAKTGYHVREAFEKFIRLSKAPQTSTRLGTPGPVSCVVCLRGRQLLEVQEAVAVAARKPKRKFSLTSLGPTLSLPPAPRKAPNHMHPHQLRLQNRQPSGTTGAYILGPLGVTTEASTLRPPIYYTQFWYLCACVLI